MQNRGMMKFEKNFAIAYFNLRNTHARTRSLQMIATAGLTLAWAGLLMLINPGNPLLMYGVFPWVCLAPLFFALYYGIGCAYVSLVIVIIAIVLKQPHLLLNYALIGRFFLGAFIMTLLTGLFSSYWLKRIKQVEHLNFYVRTHLDDLSKDYFLLKLSHDRLEHQYAAQPLSFRQAMIALRQAVRTHKETLDENLGLQLLTIFSQYCSFSHAALILFENNAQKYRLVSILGAHFAIDLYDPLIKEGLKSNTLSYRAVNQLTSHQTSAYLAMIPLITEEHLKGLILIKDMPFWSLTAENIENVMVLAADAMMHLYPSRQLPVLYQTFPKLNQDFLREFTHLVMLKKYFKVESVLSSLVLPAALRAHISPEHILQSLLQNKRTLDDITMVLVQNEPVVFILLPLTQEIGALGYAKRLAQWLKDHFDIALNEQGVLYRYRFITDEPVAHQLLRFMKDVLNEEEALYDAE